MISLVCLILLSYLEQKAIKYMQQTASYYLINQVFELKQIVTAVCSVLSMTS